MYNCIIISGLPVAGKSTLVRHLSQIYNWRILSVGGLWRSKWRQLYPDTEISFEAYWRNILLEEQQKINEHAIEIFKAGKIIGDSRYSIYCKDLPALLVFLTADLNIRVKRSMSTERYKKDLSKEIKRVLIQREMDEMKIGKALYGEDYDYRDTKHYHLVLNTGMLTVNEEILIIMSLMR